MTLVTAAFSFGRDHDLLCLLRELASDPVVADGEQPSLNDRLPVVIHDLRSDVDANRTWIAISGDSSLLGFTLERLCAAAFDRIHLQHHIGEHPRLGALDHCSVVTTDVNPYGQCGAALYFASELATRHNLPVYLPHQNDAWFALREQGFGSLLDRKLSPDYGPPEVNPRWGVAAVWGRPFFLTVALDVEEERADFLKMRVRDIRQRRQDGEAMFAGVEAVAYPAPSDGRSRMILEFSDPDSAPPDPVVEWLDRRARVAGLRVQSVEAIGAVRRVDLLETRSIPVRESQIVDMI